MFKRINLFLLSFAIVLFLTSCGKKSETETSGDKKNDDIKKTESVSDGKTETEINENSSYHIVYEIGGEKKITMELYTKGTKSKSQVDTDAGGMKMKAEAYFPGDGYVYTVTDIGKQKIGMKMKAVDTGDEDLSNKMFKAKEHLKDFEKDGTGEVLGYKCNVYKDKVGNKYYFYKDYVMLKFEGKNAVIEAKKLELNANADDKMFEVPKDITFKEMDISKFKKNK